MRRPFFHRPVWARVISPNGYAIEMDVSRPHGAIRHRLLPDGPWIEGNVPDEVRIADILGLSVPVEKDGLDQLDRLARASDPSDAPKGSADR